MRVFVTGGTGFVGPAIIRALLREGHEVTALVHRRRPPLRENPLLHLAEGDVTRKSSFEDDLAGHPAVVHLVAIRRDFPRRGLTFERMHVEATRNVVEAAKAAGVRRFLHMSASGVRPDGTGYQRTKWQAEEVVRGSGMDWTIFRPTFVTGPGEGGARGFDEEWRDIAKRAPALPNFAGGAFKLQPVALEDVATAFARALERPKAVGKTYFLAGPEVLTWRRYLERLREVTGTWRPILPVPRGPILALAGALGRFEWFPASRDELVMLFEGHAGDASDAAEDLGVPFRPWSEAVRFLSPT